jgi:AcrR family transcriptional regulator
MAIRIDGYYNRRFKRSFGMAVSSRPRRRLDPVRRPQILATAVELLRERGLWNVRIADVAKRAGISPTSVVYYFGTKDQLFAEAISAADDAFYEPLGRELDALESAVARLTHLVNRSSTSDWVLWIDLWAYSRRHPETAPAQRRFHDRWRETIAGVIRDGISSGEFRTVDADEVAQRLAALTDGLAVHMVLGDPAHPPRRYVALALAAAALELGFVT